MQKKLLKSKLVSVSFIAGAGALLLAGAVYAASAKDMRFFIQATDGGCASQLGYSRHTDFVNKTTGLGFAPWVTDGYNGYDPDCYRVNLEVATPAPAADITKDFRACLQFADNFKIDKNFNVIKLDQVGTQRCTPWASDGGGASDWATDSNLYDPDGANLEIETRALPAGTIINDIRLGMQMSDGNPKGCDLQIGTVAYTPWASAGGGWSNFAHDTNAYDPNCGRVYLEAKVSGSTGSCSEPSVCADQKVLSLANNAGSPGEGTQYAVATRPADGFGGPVPSIFTLGSSLTYEAWVYKIGHISYGGVFTAGVADLRSNGWPSLFSSKDGRSIAFRAGRSNDNNQCKGNCREYNLNQEIPTGAWTHIAVTVSGGQTLTWYVNGTQAKQETLANWDVSATPRLEQVYLGNEFPGLPEYPNAKFDEMRVWNVARTGAQIKEAMNRKVVGTEAGLVNYWNFDNGTGALQLKNGASIAADPAISPLKLCTINTCTVQPPPPQDGDIAVFRMNGTPPSFGAMTAGTEAWIDVALPTTNTKQSANPAMFVKLAANSQHTVYVTDLPNKKEVASIVQCARGSTSCAAWTVPLTIPSSGCNGTYCAFPGTVPVTANTVTRVAFGYVDEAVVTPPPSPVSCSDLLDNDNDGLTDGNDSDCGSGGGGERSLSSTPSCTLTATPATIVLNVGSSKLQWNCTGGGTVTISATNNPAFASVLGQPAQGSLNVSPSQTTIFKVTSATASATATVGVGGSGIDEITDF